MQHLKIVLSLTLVVVLMMVGVFVVEQHFRPLIDAAAAERANLAKDEVLPGAKDFPVAVDNALEEEVYDLGDTGISAIYYYEGLGYVYQATFTGYQSEITYMLGFDEAGIVTGYKTLSQNDTPNYGGNIALPEYWEQLFGLSLTDLETGNFDGITGATFTTTGWKGSFEKVVSFHNTVFLNMETTDVTSSMSNLPTSVTKVERSAQNGSLVSYTYTVEFTGYNETPSSFTVTINTSDSSIKNIAFIEVNETDGIGSHIADSDFIAQFLGLSVTDATKLNFDMVGGATYPITLGGFKTAFNEVYTYHRAVVDGYVETDAEKLIRYYEELSSDTAVLVDTTDDYTLVGTPITKVEENDDYVLFTGVFPGFADDITILVGFDKETSNLTGLRVLEANETYGDFTTAYSFMEEFTNLNNVLAMYGEFDSISGGTLTSDAVRDGLYQMVGFYRSEFLGKEVESTTKSLYDLALEKALIFYPTFQSITDVTKDYDADHLIMGIYEVKDASDQVLGYIFGGDSVGASYSETTYLHYLVAINPDKTFAGLLLIDDSETAGKADSYYLDAYSAQFVGIDVELETYPIDETSGATITNDAILAGAREVARYYVETMLGLEFARPEPTVIDTADLLEAYPSAVSFESIYLNYALDEYITNIYLAKDINGDPIGYVYSGYVPGTFLKVEFVWGVDNSDLTQNLYIISDASSWDWAPDYSGGEVFATSTFLDLYEGIQIDSILITEVDVYDSWSGVSTTTGTMRDVLEQVAQYHIDIVGGGN